MELRKKITGHVIPTSFYLFLYSCGKWSVGILLSSSQSVATICKYITNGSDDFNNFCILHYFKMRMSDSNLILLLTLQEIFQGSGEISKLPLVLITVQFFHICGTMMFHTVLVRLLNWVETKFSERVTFILRVFRNCHCFCIYREIFIKFITLFHSIARWFN